MIPASPHCARICRCFAANWPRRPDAGLFRLAIDRVFTLPGRGTVATGTARAGRAQVGDTLAVMPVGTLVRVRSIHAQNRDTEVGLSGERCALNLAGIEKRRSRVAIGWPIRRALEPTTRIDVLLRRLANGARTGQIGRRFTFISARRIESRTHSSSKVTRCMPARSARAQLVFDAPVCAVAGDSFVARDPQAGIPSAAAWLSTLALRHAGGAAPSGSRTWMRSGASSKETDWNPCCAMPRKVSRCVSWFGSAAAPRTTLRCRLTC